MRRTLADALEQLGKLEIRRFRPADKIGVKIGIRELQKLGKLTLFSRTQLLETVIDEAFENPVKLPHAAATPPPQLRNNGVRPLFPRKGV